MSCTYQRPEVRMGEDVAVVSVQKGVSVYPELPVRGGEH